VAGLLTQINSAPGKVAARMQDVSSRCQKIEAALTKLKDPKTSAAPIKAARDLRLKSIHLAQSAASPRLMKTVIVNTRMSVAAAAAETGMSVADLMKLNPALARSPFVNPGATIVAYR
jgi:LysM repeat protein